MDLESNLTPAELLETAERLFELKDQNMYRAAILEVITALEASVRDKAFPTLELKVGDNLTKWLEEKTRMDFNTRLKLFIPFATGLTVNTGTRLWNDYKKSKEIRNKVTHSGKKVTRKQARFVIETVFEWMEYLNRAQEVFIQASSRLEKVIYSAVVTIGADEKKSRKKILPLEELRRLSLVDDAVFNELEELRSLRNKAVHSHSNDGNVTITESDIQRLNQIVDEIEIKLNQSL